MKQVFIMAHQEARRRALEAVAAAPDGYSVTIKEPTRNLDQNAVLWVLLERFSEQLKWPVNGVMTRLEPEEWKTLTTAAFQRETVRVAQGLDGGMVMLGMRTSKMSKSQFSEYLDFLHATAAQRGVDIYP